MADGPRALVSSASASPRGARRWLTAAWSVENRPRTVTIAVATLLALVLAVRDRRTVVYDDVAITMRYAYRIAHGSGWTYNDGDRTNGASAPLYTMVLAIASRIGWNLETATKAIGILCYAACVGLVTFIASRIATLAGGVFAALILITSVDFRTQASSGMESVFAAALGLVAIALLLNGSETWAGVFLGLCLVNKLDAGFLALALAIAYVVIMRRPPWRIALISGAVFAPWVLFSTAYFGSPLPYSMTQKLSVVKDAALKFDRAWILNSLRTERMTLVALLALAALCVVPTIARRHRYAGIALATCVGWAVFHAVAFSLLDFGDPYAWYRTVLYPPMAIAAAVTLALVVDAVRGAVRPLAIAMVVVVVVFTMGAAEAGFGNLGTTVRAAVHGHRVDDYEGFEVTRRDAGRYLGSVAAPGDVVVTCFGWIAYGARRSPILETCPLSTRKRVGKPRWTIDMSFPGVTTPVVPPGGVIARSFVSSTGAGGRTTVIRLSS